MNSDSDPLHRARELIAAGDSVGAREVLAANRTRPECAVRLREMLLGEGRAEAAVSLLESLANGTGAEAEVSRSVLAFQRGDLQGALKHCHAALDLEPSLAAAHNHAGRALHNLGQAGQALTAFRKATEIDPEYPEAWHNLGHALRAAGDVQGAVTAYRRALELAPGYRSALHNLGVTLFNAEHVKQALECFDALLGDSPDDVEALLGGGLCRQLLGHFETAGEQFQRAIALDPGNATAHLYLGTLMNELADSPAAIAALERALELDPGDPDAWAELAGVLEQNNRLKEAADAVRGGLAAAPGHPGLLIEAARLERRRGQADAAVQLLRSMEPEHLPGRVRQQFFFELGFALDRSGDCDAAIQAFATGNRLARNSVRSRAVDEAAFEARCRSLEGWLEGGATGAVPAANDPRDDLGSDLCFLVGFPRSGTTLVDTSLDTIASVAAVEEGATLDQVIRALEGRSQGYPGALAALSGHEVSNLRAVYRRALKHHLRGRRPALTVDKMPLRFMHAGLIARLFPSARMLFVLRHPCDVVLSNFMQPFAVNETNIHFDTLEHCAQMYDRIMRLWQDSEAHIDLTVEYVRYESLVEDAGAALAGVCDFLGLDAREIRLEARARLETRQRVRTSSYQQVGEPIYSRAAGRWHRYRRHLEPYFDLLRPHAERYGYGIDRE